MICKDTIEQCIRTLLLSIGENPWREGLKDTPARVAGFWSEFIDSEPGDLQTTFETIESDQMVIVSGIDVWSLCEHHLMPFSCKLAIGYIPAGKILGLSKFARIAHAVAHKLQVQERLVAEIADEVSEATGTGNVAVVGRGSHMCMTMRGIKTPALMTTSVMRGAFRDLGAARAEFLSLANGE